MAKTLLDKETELCKQLQRLCGDNTNLHTAIERLIAQVIYAQDWDTWRRTYDEVDNLLHEVNVLFVEASLHSELGD